MLQLFSMGGVNYSTHILNNSYKVNEVDEFEEWTDANYVKHRYAGRTKVKGSFEMQFLKKSEYEAFISALSTNRLTGGTYIASLFVNNKNEVASITCFITFEAGLEQQSNLQLTTPKFKVTVEQQ